MGLWDKLEDYANAAGCPVARISPEYKNAFYNHAPWTYTDTEGKDIKVDAGAVAYGFKDDVPGIVAHELGHAKAWDNYPDLGKKLVMLSRLGANDRQLYKRLGVMLPAAGALAALYTKNPLWLAGASAAGLAAAAPMLYDEYRANEEGEKIVDELGGSKEDRDIVSGGLVSHALGATALPALGLLGGLLGKAWMDKKATFADVKDRYEVNLPSDIEKAMEEVKDRYKTMGYDLSDVGLKGSLRSRYENGAVVPFSVLPKKLQVGASWVPTANSVYFHPDLEAAMKLYGVKVSKDAFARTLAAHELAHAIDQRYADDALRKRVLQEAKDSGFTTPYLDALPFEQNRVKEIFAEYLANKALRGEE